MSSRRKRLGAECTSKTRHDDLFVCGPTVNKLTLSYSRAPIGHNDARFLLLMNSSPHPRLLVLLLLFLCGLLFLGGLLVRLLLCVCLSRTLSPSLLCACPPLSLSLSHLAPALPPCDTLLCMSLSLSLCLWAMSAQRRDRRTRYVGCTKLHSSSCVATVLLMCSDVASHAPSFILHLHLPLVFSSLA